MCISQILEYLVFIQNTETGVLLGRACIKYKYKCIEKIYIAERKKICILYVWYIDGNDLFWFSL